MTYQPPSILYTTTDEIRGTLGMTIEDIPDQILVDRNLERELTVDLYTWLPSYADLAAANTTEQDLYIADCLHLYCMYFCAMTVAETPSTFIAKISDGKNSAERFSSIDWDSIAEGLRAKAAQFQKQILEVISPASTTRVRQSTRVTPRRDPVTG